MMSCGYLFDILPFILNGWLVETRAMVFAYYSCKMVS